MLPTGAAAGLELIRPALELKAMLKHCRENVYTH